MFHKKKVPKKIYSSFFSGNYNFGILFQCFFLEFSFCETLLKKDFKIIVPKKKELYFFWNYILVKHFLKKDFKIIVPKKRNYIFPHLPGEGC